MEPLEIINSIEIIARAQDKSERVDQFLTKMLPDHSRSSIAKLIKAGAVTRNGVSIRPSQLVTGNEIFTVAVPKKPSCYMEAQDLPLDILYSDEHCAVVNKPAGMVAHPGAGVKDGTLCNALLFHFPELNLGNMERPGIVHRLDKETSGLLVIAKTESALRKLSEAFKERRVSKTYLAFAFGEFSESSFELKTGHIRHPHNRLKFFTKVLASPTVRFAHTSFTVLQSRFGMALLNANLHTGRTHQIRAHLADIDHPLLGDALYGGARSMNKAPEELKMAIAALNGQALHAESLAFPHPASGEVLYFTAPLPPHLERIAHFFG